MKVADTTTAHRQLASNLDPAQAFLFPCFVFAGPKRLLAAAMQRARLLFLSFLHALSARASFFCLAVGVATGLAPCALAGVVSALGAPTAAPVIVIGCV